MDHSIASRPDTEGTLTPAIQGQREKLSVIGHMASSIAHDLSNPLATIATSAETILSAWPTVAGSVGESPTRPPESARHLQEDLELIVAEARRASAIVRGLLAFARDEAPRWESVPLGDVVDRVARIARHHLDQFGIRIVTTTRDPGNTWVLGDANQLSQVLMNLVINAQQAISGLRAHGTIWIGIGPGPGPGDRVQVTVADDGPGVPPNLHRAVLAPYFTTKPEGTGLGLAISAHIVSEHGGTLEIADRVGGGTEVTVSLPVTTDRPASAVDPAPPPSSPARTAAQPRRLLLVDDEPGIRRSIIRFLTRVGWRVEAVPSGQEALDLLRTETFDAIVSDLRMPGMSGEEFYDTLRERQPEVARHLAFISGDTMRAESREFLDRCGCPSLSKPYEMGDLVRLIEQCSDPDRPPAPTAA